jgi:hypothetical protein
MAAPTNAALVKKTLANPEPSTHGPSRDKYVGSDVGYRGPGRIVANDPNPTLMTLSRHSSDSRVASVAPITLTVRRRGTNPTDIPRPGPARANARVGLRAKFPRQELSCRLGHDVTAADIDAGGREGAVRLLGRGAGRDCDAGL